VIIAPDEGERLISNARIAAGPVRGISRRAVTFLKR
jgi:hypothetical protein